MEMKKPIPLNQRPELTGVEEQTLNGLVAAINREENFSETTYFPPHVSRAALEVIPVYEELHLLATDYNHRELEGLAQRLSQLCSEVSMPSHK